MKEIPPAFNDMIVKEYQSRLVAGTTEFLLTETKPDDFGKKYMHTAIQNQMLPNINIHFGFSEEESVAFIQQLVHTHWKIWGKLITIQPIKPEETPK